MSNRGYRRRTILIGSTQWRLAIVNLVHFVAILVIIFAAMAFVFTRQLENSSLTAFQQQAVANRIMWFYRDMLPFMWGFFMLLIIHSVYVSNKIAGPLYQIGNVLRAVKNGDLTSRVNIRKRDYLKKEAEVVNEMIGTYQERIEDLHLISNSVAAAGTSLRRAIEQGSPDEIRIRLDQVNAGAERLKDSVAYFKVSDLQSNEHREDNHVVKEEDLAPVS